MKTEALTALKSYVQADADGVMVKVSRQALDEAIAELSGGGPAATPPSPEWIDAAALQATHEIVTLPEGWTYTRKKAAIQVIIAREMMRAASTVSRPHSPEPPCHGPDDAFCMICNPPVPSQNRGHELCSCSWGCQEAANCRFISHGVTR